MTDWTPIALDLIQQAEGLKLAAYWDMRGKVWTIGYGATGPDIGAETVWTQEQAAADLIDRLGAINRTVTQAVRGRINAQQRAALVDFTYNLGSGAFLGSTLLKLLNAGNYDGAAEQFGEWIHADGEVLPGLVTRRAIERALFKWGGS